MTLGELSKFQDYFRKYYFYRDTACVAKLKSDSKYIHIDLKKSVCHHRNKLHLKIF